MVARVRIGTHPWGNLGIFVSPPGLDVLGLAPSDYRHALSSEFGRVANVISSGFCTQETTVTTSGIVSYPAVIFRRWDGAVLYPADFFNHGTYSSYNNLALTHQRSETRFKIQYLGGGSFQIVRRRPDADPETGKTFAYVAFNLDVFA